MSAQGGREDLGAVSFVPTDESADRTLSLSYAESSALDWLAARYVCAEFVCDRLGGVWSSDEPDAELIGAAGTFSASELEEYRRLLVEENNYPDQRVPPCAGGTLADKLKTLAWSGVERWCGLCGTDEAPDIRDEECPASGDGPHQWTTTEPTDN